MSKPLKKLMSDSLRQRYEGVNSACVVDLTGLDVQKTQQIRRGLAEKRMRVEVIKNSMARLAFKQSALSPLAERMIGPCALVTGGDSIVEVAKALIQWSKEFTQITLKQAIYEGDPDLLTVERLALMRSRRELIGELAALVASPGRALAGCIQSPGGKIAGCVKSLADKGEPAAA
jgi:large subunit ribosomal protein L10